ncbi:MAG: tyrosine-type recombinase/integrase [Reyranella sp.]|nr:tyrosine-type recombinase/integrase [Reyranella sp.]
MALTDTRIRTLKPADGKAELLVADTNGLYMRVRGTTRTWQFRRKEKGKLTVTTLGTYPALALRDARLKAAELATKRSTYSPTVQEAAEQWMRERVDHTHRQAEQVRGYVDRAIVPDLGTMRVRDVEPSDVAGMVRAYRDRVGKLKRSRTDGRPAARALLAVAKGLFNYAVATGWIERSPAAQLTQAVIGAPAVARSRILTDDEIRLVMTTPAAPGPVFRFLLATGMRLGEAYNGHRDGQHWVVPAIVSKNKREHRVWLSELALAQLDSYPWAARRETVQHWATANAGGWTAHDLRRTFATRNNAMGVPPFIVEKMLNHSFDGMMAVYNHATYDDERRAALEAWSASLLALVETRPADVVPLRARA